MSKKLLMNNYSENGLMPVMDGLVCWLDGRDGKIGDTIWKDRSGNGSDAEIIGCEWTGFSLKINNNSDQFLVSKTLIDDNNKPYTLEVYFKRNFTTRGATNVILANTSKQWYGSTSIYIDVNRLYFDMGNQTLTADYTNNKPYQVAITKSNQVSRKGFLNGEFVNEHSRTTYTISFLGNWDDNKMMGEYYSIRLYNRALTEEEIKQNYLYEQSIERS